MRRKRQRVIGQHASLGAQGGDQHFADRWTFSQDRRRDFAECSRPRFRFFTPPSIASRTRPEVVANCYGAPAVRSATLSQYVNCNCQIDGKFGLRFTERCLLTNPVAPEIAQSVLKDRPSSRIIVCVALAREGRMIDKQSTGTESAPVWRILRFLVSITAATRRAQLRTNARPGSQKTESISSPFGIFLLLFLAGC
jgi:hypothetical protein